MSKILLKRLQVFLFSPEHFWPYPRLFLDTLVSGLALAIIVIVTLRAAGASHELLYGENMVFETMQVAALCGACVLSMLAAVRLRPAGRFVAITTGLICLAFFLREIPSCHSGIPLACVPRAAHRIVSYVCGGLLLLLTVLMYRASPPALLRIMHPCFSWPLIFVAGLLVTGEVFEKLEYQALEEISEFVAYTCLFLSSAWMLGTSYRTSFRQKIREQAAILLQRYMPMDHRR